MNLRTTRRLCALALLSGVEISETAKSEDSAALEFLSEVVAEHEISIPPENRGNVKSFLDAIGAANQAYSTTVVPEEIEVLTLPPVPVIPVPTEVAEHTIPPALPVPTPTPATEVPSVPEDPTTKADEIAAERFIAQCVADIRSAHRNLSRPAFGWVIEGMFATVNQVAKAEIVGRLLIQQ